MIESEFHLAASSTWVLAREWKGGEEEGEFQVLVRANGGGGGGRWDICKVGQGKITTMPLMSGFNL